MVSLVSLQKTIMHNGVKFGFVIEDGTLNVLLKKEQKLNVFVEIS